MHATDRAADKKNAAGQLHKDVNELIAASGELISALSVLKQQHNSRQAHIRHLFLLVLEFTANSRLELIDKEGDEGLHMVLHAAAAAGASAMRRALVQGVTSTPVWSPLGRG